MSRPSEQIIEAAVNRYGNSYITDHELIIAIMGWLDEKFPEEGEHASSVGGEQTDKQV